MLTIVSKTDLARNTREIVERVRSGQTVIVKSYGEEQVVLLDALDYHILRASSSYAVNAQKEVDNDLKGVVFAYLDERINLSKAAELLEISRYELMERFERAGIPLRLGPGTLEEAREEIVAARSGRRGQ